MKGWTGPIVAINRNVIKILLLKNDEERICPSQSATWKLKRRVYHYDRKRFESINHNIVNRCWYFRSAISTEHNKLHCLHPFQVAKSLRRECITKEDGWHPNYLWSQTQPVSEWLLCMSNGGIINILFAVSVEKALCGPHPKISSFA